MFDFSWAEIALIGIVALVAIGPKDLPIAIKTVAKFVKKARKMASEFQGHVDEMVREANLHEVRDEFQKLSRYDIKDQINKVVDNDGSLRAALNENPLQDPATPTILPEITAETEIATRAEPVLTELPEPVSPPDPPSFVPPGTHHSA